MYYSIIIHYNPNDKEIKYPRGRDVLFSCVFSCVVVVVVVVFMCGPLWRRVSELRRGLGHMTSLVTNFALRVSTHTSSSRRHFLQDFLRQASTAAATSPQQVAHHVSRIRREVELPVHPATS